MTLVYGNSVEPGGMLLDDETYLDQCPECGEQCNHRSYETCDGSINQNHSIDCSKCGYHKCNDEMCGICGSNAEDECNRWLNQSKQEEADDYLHFALSVTTLIDALVYLSDMEGCLLAAKAMLNIGCVDEPFRLSRCSIAECEMFSESSLHKTALFQNLLASIKSLADDIDTTLLSVQR